MIQVLKNMFLPIRVTLGFVGVIVSFGVIVTVNLSGMSVELFILLFILYIIKALSLKTIALSIYNIFCIKTILIIILVCL